MQREGKAMNHPGHKNCSCDYCASRKLFVEEFQKSMESTVASFISEYKCLPNPEAMEELVLVHTNSIAYEVLSGIVEKMVNLGFLPKDTLNPPQPESQFQAAEVPVSYDKKVN
jgi:hypothetical protein